MTEKSKLRKIIDANGMEFMGFSLLFLKRFYSVIPIRCIRLAKYSFKKDLQNKTGTIMYNTHEDKQNPNGIHV